jgi:hypothetical protein
MSGNGKATTGEVLQWPKRLLSADDLRSHLNGQREVQLLPRTIVTPLAADELRARGVRITTAVARAETTPAHGGWLCINEVRDPLVTSALQALSRDGILLTEAVVAPVARLASQVSAGAGIVVVSGDPALLCCLANKHAGVRAAAVHSAAQAARARTSLGANLFVVEMPGRTFFELRQILRTIATSPPPPCPAALAATLKEIEGHAHR